MVRIKGRSGVVLSVSPDTAEALLRGGEVEVVKDEPQPVKKAAPKPPKK